MLKIYLGPMYSGKTTELIRNFNRFRKYKQLIIDYDIENNTTKKQNTHEPIIQNTKTKNRNQPKNKKSNVWGPVILTLSFNSVWFLDFQR